MWASAQCHRLTNCASAQARVALEDELAIHKHVDAVVRPGVHNNGLRLRQEPEAVPDTLMKRRGSVGS